MVKKRIKNEEILWLAKTIIFHDSARSIPPKIQSQPSLFERLPADKSLFKVSRGHGLPIGNLTSQFFANVYMNQLDQFVKHILKARYYVRYVDDFIILGRSVEELEGYRKMIGKFLAENLGLRLHPKKQKISPLGNGIDFIGYIVRPEYVLVRRRVVGQFYRRLEQLSRVNAPWPKRQACIASYFAHINFANGYWLKKRLKKYLESLLNN